MEQQNFKITEPRNYVVVSMECTENPKDIRIETRLKISYEQAQLISDAGPLLDENDRYLSIVHEDHLEAKLANQLEQIHQHPLKPKGIV